MKKRSPVFAYCLLLIILGNLILGACRPADPTDDYTLIDPPDVAIASQIATVWLNPDWFRLRFLLADAGWFRLGAEPEDDPLSRGDETPQIDTHLPAFWMMSGEVTNKEYAMCLEAGVCSTPTIRETGPTTHFGNPDYDDHPVVGVDWFQAEGYCEWIMARLPSEAEWEKAARGSQSLVFPWGNDDPTCDKANGQLEGCENAGDTMPVGSYPMGASPYGFFDMAGNVREWTMDWYSEDSYVTAAAFAPTGPEEGTKKVVRGGGFNDFKENLRTTSRWAYEPKLDFDDVGFRCVPVTPRYAPICEPSYEPLCYDPRNPPDDEPCDPGQNVPGDEGITLLGFGCPMNEIVCFEVNTNGGGTSGYSATVDADGFECGPLDERPDILRCCGPEQPMGRNVEITVCSPGGTPDGEAVQTTAQLPSAGVALASFPAGGVISLMRTTTPQCPDGYWFDPATEECIKDMTEELCPDGWSYDEKRGCIPDDPEEDCPPGTTYTPNLEGCTPDDGECPKGYFLTDRRTCEPDKNNRDRCPPGYYFNEDTNCCDPLPPDNYGCPEGYFFHERYDKCIPLDENNCPFGMTYNGYGDCNQDPYTPGPDDLPEGDCPPGLCGNYSEQCDPDPEGDGIGTPDYPPQDHNSPCLAIADGSVNEDYPTDEINCPEGYYYDPKYETCVEHDEDGCQRGYYFDTMLEKCIPTSGPSGPCPLGYVFNPKTECCVPEPGMDSTRCPEDDTPIGTPDLTHGFAPFQTSSFDTQSGECDDPAGEEDDCPPGMFLTALGNCDQPPDDTGIPGTPGEAVTAMAQCPEEYLDPETGACTPPDPCKEGEYFDRRLGYCIPLPDDCCPIGQDYSPEYEECVDVVTKPRDGECPNGFELIDGLCWLIGRTEGKGRTVLDDHAQHTALHRPCEVGLIYNELTGRCEEPPESKDPCDDVNCGRYTSRSSCPSNCCRWDEFQTGQGTCKKK